jgi:hypothetical protein
VKHQGSYRLAAMVFVFSWIILLQTPQSFWAADLEITLIPDIDQIGSQIETVQVYRDADGDRTMFGIYDTGASVISISAEDQDWFQSGLLGTATKAVPTLISNGAGAQGIGGDLIGDVSKSGTILADGIHALNFDMNDILNFGVNTTNAMPVPNIQAFLGTTSGSPSLPSITGTPIHSTGMAAKIDLQGYKLDFGDGLVIGIPDLSFVAAKSTNAVLTATALTPTPVRIPLQLLGDNNYANPGNNVTAAPNPVQNNVSLKQGATSLSGKTFLFDTGAQMTIISTTLAANLGLDLSTPTFSIDVQGAAGNPISVPGFNLDSLELPRIDQSNNPIADKLKLSTVPIFVLDLGVDGLDGILGMNLWNTATGMLYDPTDPNNAYVDMTFSDDPNRGLTQEQLDQLTALNPLIAYFSGALRDKNSLRTPLIGAESVPEPSALILLATGVLGLVFHQLRKEFCRYRN